jgi:hypothetical protein
MNDNSQIFLSTYHQTPVMDFSLSTPQKPESAHPATESKQTGPADRFFPTGAIAFFVALVLLCLVIWFGIYFLMIERI